MADAVLALIGALMLCVCGLVAVSPDNDIYPSVRALCVGLAGLGGGLLGLVIWKVLLHG